MPKPGIIATLRNTKFKAKKGTDAYEYFGKKDIYISEMNSSGGLALCNLSPKERDLDDDKKPDEFNSAWHEEDELTQIT